MAITWAMPEPMTPAPITPIRSVTPGSLARCSAMAGALDDITVLEVANWVAAPSCCALMADMGANAIKVEPLGGDSGGGELRQPVFPEAAPRTASPVQRH